MIFLTVGTLFPFDRLVRVVDKAVAEDVIRETVFGQIGEAGYVPRHFEAVASLDKGEFDRRFKAASAVISHAGMGNIFMAIDMAKPLLIMPRMRKYKEHVNDHQVHTAETFEQLGHVLAAYDDTDQFSAKLKRLNSFVPKPREHQLEQIVGPIRERLVQFLS